MSFTRSQSVFLALKFGNVITASSADASAQFRRLISMSMVPLGAFRTFNESTRAGTMSSPSPRKRRRTYLTGNDPSPLAEHQSAVTHHPIPTKNMREPLHGEQYPGSKFTAINSASRKRTRSLDLLEHKRYAVNGSPDSNKTMHSSPLHSSQVGSALQPLSSPVPKPIVLHPVTHDTIISTATSLVEVVEGARELVNEDLGLQRRRDEIAAKKAGAIARKDAKAIENWSKAEEKEAERLLKRVREDLAKRKSPEPHNDPDSEDESAEEEDSVARTPPSKVRSQTMLKDFGFK